MHHLINEYRPVQARDTLRQMIIRQNEEIRVFFKIYFSINLKILQNVTLKLKRYMESGHEALAILRTFFRNLPYEETIPKLPPSFNEPTGIDRNFFINNRKKIIY